MKLPYMYILFVKGERTQSIAQKSNPLKHYTQSKGINKRYKHWTYNNCMEHRTLKKLTAMWLLKFHSFCGSVSSLLCSSQSITGHYPEAHESSLYLHPPTQFKNQF